MKLKSFVTSAVVLTMLSGFSTTASAVVISMTDLGSSGGSTIFGADLNALGITSLSSVSIIDDNDGVGGASGIFSGADIDAVFLDADGSLATAGDRTFASSFLYSAGTVRATSNTSMQPNATHPGPLFGALDASTIDAATATLNVFDGVSIADVDFADGFLTLGDGGSLSALFSPDVTVSGMLYLIVGEVGQNESLGADVRVNEVPGPASILVFLAGLGLLLSSRLTRHAA